MDLRVAFADDSESNQAADLESLSIWLRETPELAGRVTDTRVPVQGELGAVSDALVVSVGSGGTLSVLILSLKAWLAQPRKSRIRIRVESQEGTTIEVEADRIDRDQVETLMQYAVENGLMER